MCVVSFVICFFGDTLISIEIPYWGYARVQIVNLPISDGHVKLLGFKTEYTPRVGSVFNCFAYDHDWTVKEE